MRDVTFQKNYPRHFLPRFIRITCTISSMSQTRSRCKIMYDTFQDRTNRQLRKNNKDNMCHLLSRLYDINWFEKYLSYFAICVWNIRCIFHVFDRERERGTLWIFWHKIFLFRTLCCQPLAQREEFQLKWTVIDNLDANLIFQTFLRYPYNMCIYIYISLWGFFKQFFVIYIHVYNICVCV